MFKEEGVPAAVTSPPMCHVPPCMACMRHPYAALRRCIRLAPALIITAPQQTVRYDARSQECCPATHMHPAEVISSTEEIRKSEDKLKKNNLERPHSVDLSPHSPCTYAMRNQTTLIAHAGVT